MAWRNLLLVVLLCGGVSAEEAARNDTTDVYETRHYPLLSVPRLVWTGLVYPLGRFVIYAEAEELPERVVDWFTNEDETFGFFPYAQLGGETGTGGGFSTFHTNLFGREKEFGAQFIMADPERYHGQALYQDPNVAGSASYWNVEAEYLKTDQDDATINGAAHRQAGLLFALEQVDARTTLGWRPNAFALEEYRDNLYLEARLGVGTRDFAQVLGTAQSLPGLAKEISLFSIGARIAYDNRDYKDPVHEISHPLNYEFPGRVLLLADDFYHSFRDIYYPEHGGLLQAEVDFVTGSDDARFWRLTAEAHRFFALFWPNRILGLRARLEKAHPVGDDHFVPYPDQPTLGGSQRLRAYKRGYYRGEGALLLSAEYRYPIWDTWNSFLFWEEGQVFDRYDQIKTGNSHSSFGAGISVRTEEALLISLRVAHSAAEVALVGFSLEQEF